MYVCEFLLLFYNINVNEEDCVVRQRVKREKSVYNQSVGDSMEVGVSPPSLLRGNYRRKRRVMELLKGF